MRFQFPSRVAHNVANGVCNSVESKGYRVLDAIVVQRGIGSERGGEHDLICERRDCGDGGLTSFEIKLRQAVKDDTLSKARRDIQKLAWVLILAARIDPKRYFTERVAVCLRWGASDPFNLGGWSDSFADVISINADADVPGNWHPLWGWTRTLPTAEEAAAKARDAAKRKAAVAAQMKAQAQAQKDFDLKYKRCRKCDKRCKEMRSVSDLLLSK